MSKLNKFLKIARAATLKPDDNIENKIIDRISHLNEKDKELLDENFLDYFKKSNSRAYMAGEQIKNHPGSFTMVLIAAGIFIGFISYLLLKIIPSKKSSTSIIQNQGFDKRSRIGP